MGLFNYLFFGSSERPHVHDWETVEYESRYSIELRIEREGGKCPTPPGPPNLDARGRYIPEPERRVCMTCGKCEDHISEYEADVRRRIQEAEDRKCKALLLWHSQGSGLNNG